jgi:hypothetical protein
MGERSAEREEAVEGDLPSGGASTSPWNSLEVAKISATVATSLAIFGLGVMVTLSTERQRTGREKEAIASASEREERAYRRAAERERAVEDRARRDRVQGLKEAAAERQELADRERSLRQETRAYEASLRAQANNEANRLRIFRQRVDAWAQTSPRFAAFSKTYLDLMDTALRQASTKEVSARLLRDWLDFKTTFAPLAGFFSSSVDKVFHTLDREVLRVGGLGEREGSPADGGTLVEEAANMNILYACIIETVREELRTVHSNMSDYCAETIKRVEDDQFG